MEDKLQHTSATIREFTLHSLRHITNNFSKEHVIGSGGYGVVYKGKLDNGEEIALKKLHHIPGLDDTQFRNEFNNLMRAQHQNIVRLVGYCYDVGHQRIKHNGEYVFALVEERILCFEYLHGGSLDKHVSDESCGLDWRTRFKIIKGVCEGLNYLHNGYKDPIYHMDLKPANILLDKDMKPKIGDFGLSRLFPSSHTYTTIKIIGTPGYMPPEYIEKYEITSKFDVFSLGVIIIRVMAGDEGYSKCAHMSSQEFMEHVHENWRKRLPETMSPDTSQEVMTCIEIALRCVEADRARRPTISEIVTELNKIDSSKSSPICQLQEIENTMENKLQHTSAAPREFTFHLLQHITNQFSEEHIVGRGGYGIVFKGVLDTGEEIAVKKLYNQPGIDDDQFKNELINLMKLQHQNIVRLVGYCYETRNKLMEYNGRPVFASEDERAICFEYLHGGSLEQHLTDEPCALDWHTRYKIIKGICDGLKYLHKGSKDSIYHLDLKPANILLDKNMIPKIGDFGLSRLFGSTQTCITERTLGTRGYMPPEYIHGGQISQKFDVFSLGVIIIQIVAGKDGYYKCADMPFQEFIEHVHENWRKRLHATMSSHISEEVNTCIEIALRCVEPNRMKRPTITEIVVELNKVEIAKSSLIRQATNSRSFNQYVSSDADTEDYGVEYSDDEPIVVVPPSSGVGKSNLLLRFGDGYFNTSFITTIGIDCKIRTVELDGKRIKLQIWDTADQELFPATTAAYYRGTMGALLVYDVNDESSFNSIREWKKRIEKGADGNVNTILVGNRADIDKSKRAVPTSMGQELADEYGIKFFETSAKTNLNVDQVFFSIVRDIKQRLQETHSVPTDPNMETKPERKARQQWHKNPLGFAFELFSRKKKDKTVALF